MELLYHTVSVASIQRLTFDSQSFHVLVDLVQVLGARLERVRHELVVSIDAEKNGSVSQVMNYT